jgi:hypothetical protein
VKAVEYFLKQRCSSNPEIAKVWWPSGSTRILTGVGIYSWLALKLSDILNFFPGIGVLPFWMYLWRYQQSVTCIGSERGGQWSYVPYHDQHMQSIVFPGNTKFSLPYVVPNSWAGMKIPSRYFKYTYTVILSSNDKQVSLYPDFAYNLLIESSQIPTYLRKLNN